MYVGYIVVKKSPVHESKPGIWGLLQEQEYILVHLYPFKLGSVIDALKML